MDRPTDRQTDRQTDIVVHREVTLPKSDFLMKKNYIVIILVD